MSRIPSPVDRAKARVGFIHAFQRPSCKNCAHVTYDIPTGARGDCWSLRCQIGGFGVTSMSCCNQHEPKEVRRAIPKPLVA